MVKHKLNKVTRLAVVSIMLLNFSMCSAQTDEMVYYRSIIYIGSNSSVAKTIRGFFKKDVKSKMCVNESFWISNEIPYIDIRLFDSELYFNQIFLQNDTIKSEEHYQSFYQGLKGKTLLNSLATIHEKQPLRLVLSRVLGNVVLAELLLDHDPSGSYNDVTKLGKGLRFLIYFDKSGNILKVFTAGIAYG